ncbi:hypothetical protein Peur_034442 [Populus x canadensis]
MGCRGGPWVFALLSTEALIFYCKEKIVMEEGRDRRRLKLSTLTDYGKEQDMGIEALEAMLMDMMSLEVCCFGFLARSVLFPVGKGGEQGAVSSIKIYIWFAVYAQSP